MAEEVRRNWLRRIIGVLICLSPLVYLLASLFHATGKDAKPTFENLNFYIGGAIFACINFYLTFIRATLWRLRRKSMDEWKNVSGLPTIGTFCIFVACYFSFGAFGSTLVGLVILILDTGGLPWIVIFTWKDTGLWDAKTT